MTRIEKAVAFSSLWVARLAMCILAVAGMIHLLGGVDPVILYPVSVLSVAFLLKETL
jgi:hypothetical protein